MRNLAALDYLNWLIIIGPDIRVTVDPNDQAVGRPRLWLLGFGYWTGFASPTLIGGGRMARETVRATGAIKSNN